MPLPPPWGSFRPVPAPPASSIRCQLWRSSFHRSAACAIHLAADHPEGYDRYSPMVSRLLHLLVIDVLATCVALRIGGSLQPILQQMKENLRAKRYA